MGSGTPAPAHLRPVGRSLLHLCSGLAPIWSALSRGFCSCPVPGSSSGVAACCRPRRRPPPARARLQHHLRL